MTTLNIPPMADRFVLTTGWNKQGEPQYYTGRGGEGWIGPRAEAFTMGEGEAKRKAEILNRMSEVHSFTFWIQAA
jgi:hypothetical protein